MCMHACVCVCACVHSCCGRACPCVQVGFFLMRYAPLFRTHLLRLTDLLAAGKLRVQVDPSR